MKRMIILYTFLSIFCVALGGVFAYLASREKSKADNKVITDTLEVYHKENKRLTKENLEYSKSSSANTDKITGKGSFPFAQVSMVSPNEETIFLSVVLFGENPIKDLNIWSSVVENYSETAAPIDMYPFTLSSISQPNYKIERLTNGGNAPNLISFDNTLEEICMLLYFRGEYGAWAEYLFRTKVNGRWEQLSILVDESRFVLDRTISKNFPITDDGYVYLNNYAKYKYDDLMGKRIDFADFTQQRANLLKSADKSKIDPKP